MSAAYRVLARPVLGMEKLLSTMKHIMLAAALLPFLLAACAPAAMPTIDPANVEASAVAAAGTITALTQAAVPIDTPVPPTPLPSETPPPTSTPATLESTLPVLTSPTAPASAGGSSDCGSHRLDIGSAGPTTTLLIRNDTKGTVLFSMGLASKNSFGQCGYVGWSIPKLQSITVSVPMTRTNQGDPCYWAAAFIQDPQRQTTVSGGNYCMNITDKWTFDVGYDRIKLTPP